MSQNHPLAQVKAFCFDVFGTVVDWRTTMVKALDEALPPDTRPYVNSVDFVNQWRQGYIEAMTKYSQHSFYQENYPELDEIHLEILEKLLCSHNLQGSLSHDAKYNLNQGWHRLDPWSDSTEGLASLQKSAITATLSNGTVRLLTDLSRYGNLHFDVIFSGETFLSFKPNAAMYLGAVRLLKLKPEEVCMVAAHGKDLQFAKKNGLKTAFVYREGEGHAADEISTALSYVDVRVQDLIELSTLYHSAKGPSA